MRKWIVELNLEMENRMELNFVLIIILSITGMLGAICRYNISNAKILIENFQEKSYFITIIINIMGCFVMGLFFPSFILKGALIDYFITGFVSGFTTFSGFIHNFHNLKERNQKWGLYYVILSIFSGLISFYIGLIISI